MGHTPDTAGSTPPESGRWTTAARLAPGDTVDLPAALTEGTENETAGRYEYAVVEQVTGGTATPDATGWADGSAGPGQVVIYTHNMVAPVVASADHPVLVLEPRDPGLETEVVQSFRAGDYSGPRTLRIVTDGVDVLVTVGGATTPDGRPAARVSLQARR